MKQHSRRLVSVKGLDHQQFLHSSPCKIENDFSKLFNEKGHYYIDIKYCDFIDKNINTFIGTNVGSI
jgi:hypothetical protein